MAMSTEHRQKSPDLAIHKANGRIISSKILFEKLTSVAIGMGIVSGQFRLFETYFDSTSPKDPGAVKFRQRQNGLGVA